MKPVRSPRLLRFYGSALRGVLRGGRRIAMFAVACTMHALGHTAVAWAAALVAMSLAGGGSSRLFGSTLPGLVGPVGVLDGAGGSVGADAAISLTLVGLAAVAVKVAGATYASYVQAELGGEVGGALRLHVLDALLTVHRLRRPRQADQGRANGEAQPAALSATSLAALTAGVRDVENGLAHGLLGGVRAAAQLVPIAALLAAIAPKLAAAALLVLLPFALGLSRARRAFKQANAKAAREHEALLEAADQAVRHADLWVTFGAQRKVRRAVADVGRAIALRYARVAAGGAAISGGNEILGALALLLAVAAARFGLLGDVGGGPRLLAFAFAFFLAYKPLRDLGEARLALARASEAFDRLRDAGMYDDRAAASEPKAARRRWALADLELRELSVARGSARRALSVRIGPGEIVAITGATGAGKTTLLRTLLGLEDAAGGEILFDGLPLAREPGPQARPFDWVPQDAPILIDTLEANVTLDAPLDARAALASIGASALAEKVGDARLDGGGRSLSGGERQWVSIARAIATEQPILLLDEPTSGLDAASQARVLDAIAALRGRRTVVMVTHRAEPIAIADRVIAIDDPRRDRAPREERRVDAKRSLDRSAYKSSSP